MSKMHFSEPGCYRIKVAGTLPPNWFDRLGAMRVSAPARDGNQAVTFMQGRVADQAELSGILNSLYDLHLPLLSVQFIGEKIGSDGSG